MTPTTSSTPVDFQYAAFLDDRFGIGKSWQRQLAAFCRTFPLNDLAETTGNLIRSNEPNRESVVALVEALRRTSEWGSALASGGTPSKIDSADQPLRDRGPEILRRFLALNISSYQAEKLDPATKTVWQARQYLTGAFAAELPIVAELHSILNLGLSTDTNLAIRMVRDLSQHLISFSLNGSESQTLVVNDNPATTRGQIEKYGTPFRRIISEWGLGEVFARIVPDQGDAGSIPSSPALFIRWVRALGVSPEPLGPRLSHLRSVLIDESPTEMQVEAVKLVITRPAVIGVFDAVKERISASELVDFFLNRGKNSVGNSTLEKLVFNATKDQGGVDLAVMLIRGAADQLVGIQGGVDDLVALAQKRPLGLKLLEDFTRWIGEGEPLKARVVAWALSSEIDGEKIALLRKKLGNTPLKESTTDEFQRWARKIGLIEAGQSIPGLRE